jgi:hypothetical protein
MIISGNSVLDRQAAKGSYLVSGLVKAPAKLATAWFNWAPEGLSHPSSSLPPPERPRYCTATATLIPAWQSSGHFSRNFVPSEPLVPV